MACLQLGCVAAKPLLSIVAKGDGLALVLDDDEARVVRLAAYFPRTGEFVVVIRPPSRDASYRRWLNAASSPATPAPTLRRGGRSEPPAH